jgi:hypothetical protein
MFAPDGDEHNFRAGCCRIAFGMTTVLVLLSSLARGVEPTKSIAHWLFVRDARDEVGTLHCLGKQANTLQV